MFTQYPAARSQQQATVTFSWLSYTNAADAFKLYSSPDLTVPLGQWTLAVVVPETNTCVTNVILPGQMFFYLTASNLWGESPVPITVGKVNANLIDYGSNAVFLSNETYSAPPAGYQDVWITNAVSWSYGCTNLGYPVPLLPGSNQCTFSAPLIDWTCNYAGTNLMIYSTANISALTFAGDIDGQEIYPYTTINAPSFPTWLHFVFEKPLTHTIRLRTLGNSFGGDRVRIALTDAISPTTESAKRVNVLLFGDSHVDGNDIYFQMQTLVNRMHHFLVQYPAATFFDPFLTSDYCNVFGSAIGGTGYLNPGSFGYTFTNRFFFDVFQGPGVKPDVLFVTGANNDLSLITSDVASNQFIAAVSNICYCISTNMPGSNVWMCPGPGSSGTDKMTGVTLFMRDVIRTNCLEYGFNLIDFTGGATNVADVNRGLITDANQSYYVASDGHLTIPGKELFALIVATNIQPRITSLRSD